MRCTSLAVLLGLSLPLAYPSIATAQPFSEWTWGCGNGNTCGAALTARIHQHGPLFNYGPYYGYPPFTPYGPWNAYLQYNPWYYGVPPARGVTCSHGDLAGHGPVCPGWNFNWHAPWSHGGWYHGCSTCCQGGLFTSQDGWAPGYITPPRTNNVTGSVSDLAAPTKISFNPETTDPFLRYAGAGNSSDFKSFYAGLPTLDPSLDSGVVVPASGNVQ
jgi:hypothetical protein